MVQPYRIVIFMKYQVLFVKICSEKIKLFSMFVYLLSFVCLTEDELLFQSDWVITNDPVLFQCFPLITYHFPQSSQSHISGLRVFMPSTLTFAHL